MKLRYPKKFMAGSIEPHGPEGWIWPEEDFGVWEGPRHDWVTKFKPWIDVYLESRVAVVQAGGACGMYPRLLAGLFENVYTFEPDPVNFYFLNLNCPNENVRKFNCALGERHRVSTFYPPADTNRGVGVIRPSQDQENDIYTGNTPVLTIDDFNFKELNLIFLDIENYELYALKGSINTIEKHKPVIICESATEEIIEFLRTYGYSVVEKSGADTLFRVEDGTV